MPRTRASSRRTLITRRQRAATVSYLEGCTAPQRDTHQLHAAVVELVALDDAEIKYSTVQNWYPRRRGRPWPAIYNFRHQAAPMPGRPVQGEVDAGGNRLRDHVEIPRLASCAATTARGSSTPSPSPTTPSRPTPAPRWCIWGKRTKSRIVSKGISAGRAQNTYRGLVSMHPKAKEKAATTRNATAF